MRQVFEKKNLELFSAIFGSWRFFVLIILAAAIIFGGRFFVWAASVNEIKESLRQNLDQIQSQIDQYRAQISAAQKEAKTLKRDIQLLDSKIKQAELEIQQTQLVLQQTELAISEKSKEIDAQQKKLEREKNLLGQYLQTIYEADQETTIELIFGQERLSDVFSEINSLDVIQKETYDVILQIKTIKEDLEGQKDDLLQKKDEELQLQMLQQAQKTELRYQQMEKKNLLTQTKGQESAYQKMLQKAKEDVTAIKKQIYLLEGVGLAMSLEEAYKHAKYAADLIDVRPAFLLAVLKQESSWGTNVGTGFWKQDMRQQDQAAFVQICDELNLDPDKMPVSRKPSYGWGGAMGPAQFLPTTWLNYKDQVAKVTGHNPPSPWDIDDSFTAAAIKLAAAGANQKTPEAEWKAAMIYFAGNNWGKKIYSFYGDSVMDLAQTIQDQLDLMNK